MGSVMKDLFYGNLDPCDDNHRQEPEYIRASRKESKACAGLIRALGEKEKALFGTYLEAHGEIEDLDLLARFSSGLKFGIMLMAEVFRELNREAVNGRDCNCGCGKDGIELL